MATKLSTPHPVRREYIPPSSAMLHDFARQFCHHIAHSGDADFASFDVVNGFAQFLEVMATIQARTRTDAESIDRVPT